MGDDIGLGSVCFYFPSTNIVQRINRMYVVYGHLMTIDDSSSWTRTNVITHESSILGEISYVFTFYLNLNELPQIQILKRFFHAKNTS